MDNITHTLVGLAAAKAGLGRVSPYATALCIVAANAPDADIVTLLGGQFFYLKHHRGVTHSIAGTLALAVLLPLLFYAGDRLAARLRRRPPRARLKGLLLASTLLCASHPLLDWTNNYGLRPFLPWDGRWFYGDLVFILDPWIWLTVGGAAFLLTARTKWSAVVWAALAVLLTAGIILVPRRAGFEFPAGALALWLAGLAALVFAHRAKLAERWGAGIPAAALALVVVYWGGLALLHGRALARAEEEARSLAAGRGETVLRVAAMPMLANPLRWRSVAETDGAFLRYDLSAVGVPGSESLSQAERFEKPAGTEATLVGRAGEDTRAEIFLEFSRFPAARVERGCAGDILVQLADLRFTEPGGGRRGSFALEIPLKEK